MTMTTTDAMTAAGYITQAERNLADQRNGNYPPSTQAYQGLTLSAIANTLTAIALMWFAQDQAPAIPGLPEGYRLDTHQDPDGDRKWGYVLTAPDGHAVTSRHLWGSSEGALSAGIQAARASRDAELPS